MTEIFVPPWEWKTPAVEYCQLNSRHQWSYHTATCDHKAFISGPGGPQLRFHSFPKQPLVIHLKAWLASSQPPGNYSKETVYDCSEWRLSCDAKKCPKKKVFHSTLALARSGSDQHSSEHSVMCCILKFFFFLRIVSETFFSLGFLNRFPDLSPFSSETNLHAGYVLRRERCSSAWLTLLSSVFKGMFVQLLHNHVTEQEGVLFLKSMLKYTFYWT